MTRNWLAGVTAQANAKVPAEDFSLELAQINHYSVRTYDLFTLKRHRGRGFRSKRATVGARHTSRFFAQYNRNDAEDRSILRFEGATQREIDRILAVDCVRAAHEHGMRLTVERIALMSQELDMPLPNPTDIQLNVATPSSAETLFVPAVTLPGAESALLREEYARHDIILEYGSGGSTLVAAQQQHSLVMSVESDRIWAENMRAVMARDFPDANLHIHWADIGPTRKWGRPANESQWRKFPSYSMSVWDQDWFSHPDLILIDGRFRVGCLLTALLRIERPVTVLFDDYATRGHYIRAVETFAKPSTIVGRMAKFEIEPVVFPRDRMTEIVTLLLDPE